MRYLAAALLLVTACSNEPGAPSLATGNFAGAGRDRLCIAGSGEALRAGVIVYGEGDTNCSASGALAQTEGRWSLTPRGEPVDGCRITLSIVGGKASIGSVGPQCDYYCGPGAQFSGKSFDLGKAASPATDLAGDALC